MTREEAIEQLQNCKGLIKQDGKDWLDERDIPLLDMAIEALQAEYIIPSGEVMFTSELVRCKDCRHANKSMFCSVYLQPRLPSDFCSYGERREP